VIPQKLNLPMNFFEIIPEKSLLSTVSKKAIKMIGHHSRLRWLETVSSTFQDLEFDG